MTDTYPQTAGWKATETSREAAESISVTEAQEEILYWLAQCGPMTPDEFADQNNWSILFVRPRFSELKRKGLIKPTGERRKNASGRAANVMRAV